MRELALSYFHEYFLDNGIKTLREFSKPFNLNRYNSLNWETTSEHLWQIPQDLDNSIHYELVPKSTKLILRKADPFERTIGKITEWKLVGRTAKLNTLKQPKFNS